MGDIVPVSGSALVQKKAFDPEKELEQYEKRLKEAQVLEEKLRRINEDVPTRIYNVMGSAAGAGSGDFHHFRQVRRAEQDRLRKMDEDWNKEQKEKEYKERMEQLQEQQESKTAKKRAKRQKQKAKKKTKKVDAGTGSGDAAADGQSSDEEQADLD